MPRLTSPSAEGLHAEGRDIGGEALDHFLRLGRAERAFWPGRRVVVGEAEGQVGASEARASLTHLREAVMRALVDVMAVYGDQRAAVACCHDMRVPDLVDQRRRHRRSSSRCGLDSQKYHVSYL